LFTPLLASWSGRRELMNLGQVELSGCVYRLEGNALLCAFYLNELLTRLLQRTSNGKNASYYGNQRK